jgi:ubiquinone/menaquinone biosynthesis C-methylase UbiE
MTTSGNYEKWKKLQSHWDDDEFLKTLTPLMKLRYRLLDETTAAIIKECFESFEADGAKPFLLDMGCGRGEFALFLKSAWKPGGEPWAYLGLEPSREQLKQRDVPTLGLGFLQAAAEQVPLQDMVAHGVLIKEVIDHCYDPLQVFREAARLLKPGGALVVTVTNDKSWFKRLLPWVNASHKAQQDDHLSFFGPQELKKLAREALFDRVLVETYNYLKLPRFLEKALGLLGSGVCRSILKLTDSLGKKLLPGMGGGIILTARK